jgi:hypothetical protein
VQASLSSPCGLVLCLGCAELAVLFFFFFALLSEPCNFVALVMKFGQKPLVEKKYCWLVAGGWFVVREKYWWLVADKPT